MEPTLLPPRESLLGEPRKTAPLLFMSIGAQAQFGFDICGAGSRSLKEKKALPQNRRPKNGTQKSSSRKPVKAFAAEALALQAAQIYSAGSSPGQQSRSAVAFSSHINRCLEQRNQQSPSAVAVSSRIGSSHRVSSRIGSPNSLSRVSSRISSFHRCKQLQLAVARGNGRQG